MKKLLMHFTLVSIFLLGSFSFAGETFESDEAKFRITFPTDFDIDTEEEDGTTTISLSCTFGGMIIIANVYIYADDIPEDENTISEAEAVVRVANAFGSKVNDKKISVWYVGEEYGIVNPLKTKLDGSKYIGNYYVIIKKNIQYQFTLLAGKKEFDKGVESKFINSFSFLN